MLDHDAVWTALSHPARRQIVDELRHQPATTGELHLRLENAALTQSRFATQRHLQALREADLVIVDERGRERVNSLNGSALYQATIGWLDPHSARIAHGLDHLKSIAERSAQIPIAETKENPVSAIEHLHVEQGIDIAATAERVWQALTHETEAWWHPPFTLLPESRAGSVRLKIPEEVGGSVIEQDGDRKAVWGQLVEVAPEESLAFTSRVCGADAAAGTVRFTLEPIEDGVRLTFRQEAIGVFGNGMHAAVNQGWQDKLQRMQEHLSTTN